jgi:hypothetical protein
MIKQKNQMSMIEQKNQMSSIEQKNQLRQTRWGISLPTDDLTKCVIPKYEYELPSHIQHGILIAHIICKQYCKETLKPILLENLFCLTRITSIICDGVRSSFHDQEFTSKPITIDIPSNASCRLTIKAEKLSRDIVSAEVFFDFVVNQDMPELVLRINALNDFVAKHKITEENSRIERAALTIGGLMLIDVHHVKKFALQMSKDRVSHYEYQEKMLNELCEKATKELIGGKATKELISLENNYKHELNKSIELQQKINKLGALLSDPQYFRDNNESGTYYGIRGEFRNAESDLRLMNNSPLKLKIRIASVKAESEVCARELIIVRDQLVEAKLVHAQLQSEFAELDRKLNKK